MRRACQAHHVVSPRWANIAVTNLLARATSWQPLGVSRMHRTPSHFLKWTEWLFQILLTSHNITLLALLGGSTLRVYMGVPPITLLRRLLLGNSWVLLAFNCCTSPSSSQVKETLLESDNSFLLYILGIHRHCFCIITWAFVLHICKQEKNPYDLRKLNILLFTRK